MLVGCSVDIPLDNNARPDNPSTQRLDGYEVLNLFAEYNPSCPSGPCAGTKRVEEPAAFAQKRTLGDRILQRAQLRAKFRTKWGHLSHSREAPWRSVDKIFRCTPISLNQKRLNDPPVSESTKNLASSNKLPMGFTVSSVPDRAILPRSLSSTSLRTNPKSVSFLSLTVLLKFL